MSAELRLKKLRGSGGYVMAQISDQQQTKGNLGGPDLFLAPVGRIDSEKISKHFCNTCEEEFEAGPKIDFESPNEVVAENLVLVEKGKYLCNVCSSVIAEYREFKKSDEEQEIGLAKPIQQTAPEPRDTKPQDAKPQDAKPQDTEPQKIESQNTESVDSTVNSIEGLAVFDENARKLGTAKQVGVDSTNTVVLSISKNDGSNISVPWSKIKTVGEVILLGDSEAQQPASEPGKCPKCGFANKADAKFCEECGNKLA